MSKLQPVAHRVIVKPDKLEDVVELEQKYEQLSRGRFEIVKPDGAEYREKRAVTKGTVVAIGWMAWKAIDGQLEGWKPWCQVGDKVHFGRYAGELVYDPETNEELFILNDEDILVVEASNG